MATSSNRDVKMTLSVETLGAEDIKKLQDSVSKLATEGGQAAPEFQKLADEIGRLGEQSSALNAFRQLADATADLAAKQKQAAQDATELGAKLQAAEKQTKDAAAAQRQAADALSELQSAARQTRDSLAQLTAQTAEAKKADDSYAQAVSDLKLKKIEQRAEIEKGAATLKQANDEVVNAEAAEKKLAASYEYTASQAKAAATALRENESSAKAAANAAELLGVSTKNVAASQATLIQGLNSAGKAALETKAAIDQYQEKLRAAKAEADATATAAKDAADKISNAFKTVGARSAEELRSEIAKVREAMNTVKASAAVTGEAVAGAFAAGNARIKELERNIREVSGTLTMADKAAGLLKNSMGQITAGNIVADGVGYLVNKVKELGVAFLGAIVDGDQMRRGLNAIYKDATVTASQIDFLRRSSSESGVAFGQLSKEFVKFSASMQLSNIPLEQSNNLFKAVTAATASLGLGSEATAGALNALGQMASKGTVSLEELRQQLGDRLPGAIGLTAKGLGITEAQLIKLVESGGLATRDFIVPFTKALGELKGESDGLVPAFDRLKGTLSEVAQGMGDAGGTTFLTGALKILGGLVGVVVMALSAAVEGLFLLGAAVTATAARLLGDSGAWEFFAEQVNKSNKRLGEQEQSLRNFLAPSEAAAASTTKHAAAMTANTVEVVKSINANASLSVAQKLTALSTALISEATSGAASNIVQYNVASDAMLKQQTGQTDAYNKLAKAAKEQGDTLIKQAELTGDVTLVQKAQLVAVELTATETNKLAVSQQAELDILIARKEVLLADSKARGITADQIKVQADELDRLIVKTKSETEQTNQSAIASRAAKFERELTIEKLKDHSSEIEKFKLEVERTAATLKDYERLELQGKKTKAEVVDATEAHVRALALLRDGYEDTITKIDLEAKAKGANLQLSIVQSNTAQKHAELMAAQSRAIGDVTMATFYDIEAKEASIKTVKLQMQLAVLESEAALKTIEIKRLEIPLNDALRTQKLAVLDIEAALIKVKLAGNEAAKETIKSIENEITALRNGTTAYGGNTSAIGSNTGARNNNRSAIDEQSDAMDRIAMRYKLSADYTERQIALLERETAAIQKAIDAENKRLNRDKDGFTTDKSGNKLSMGGDLTTRTGIKKFLQSAGVNDDAQATRITNEFANSKGEIDYFNNAGQMNYGGANSTISEALLKAAEKYTFAGNPIGGANNVGVAAPRPGAPAPTPANSGQTVLVKIDLGNGRTYDVNTASANDASQLQNFMSALQDARRGAGM